MEIFRMLLLLLASTMLLVSSVATPNLNKERSGTTLSQHEATSLRLLAHETAKRVLPDIPPSLRLVNWVFLHYHKTGHDLVNYFSKHFKEKDCHAKIAAISGRTSVTPHLNNIRNNDITLLAGMNLYIPWNESFAKHGHQIRVVHFVRDPYDMIISGYSYHSQIPTPEPWLNDRAYKLCTHHYDTVSLEESYKTLGKLRNEHGNGTEVVRKLVMDAANMCAEMVKNLPMSFSEMLKKTRDENNEIYGVKLEAFRVGLSDFLFMATNAMFEEKAVSHRVFMSEFPVGNKTTFIQTTTKIFTFLEPPEDLQFQPFWQCKSLDAAVEDTARQGFVPVAHNVSSKHSSHITTAFLSADTKARYISALKEDIVLGPLIQLIVDALKVYN